jgi:hypothetical protein
VVCLAPRAPGDSVRPRRLSGVVVRPLNFTVRSHGVMAVVTLSAVADAGRGCRVLASVVVGIVSTILVGGCYCPGGNCDYAFRPNYEARHRVFVEDLNAWMGRPFNHVCLTEGTCSSHTLEAGLVRYIAVDWRPWMKGCTFWYDVDPASNIVKSVGYSGTDQECSSGPLR